MLAGLQTPSWEKIIIRKKGLLLTNLWVPCGGHQALGELHLCGREHTHVQKEVDCTHISSVILEEELDLYLVGWHQEADPNFFCVQMPTKKGRLD